MKVLQQGKSLWNKIESLLVLEMMNMGRMEQKQLENLKDESRDFFLLVSWLLLAVYFLLNLPWTCLDHDLSRKLPRDCKIVVVTFPATYGKHTRPEHLGSDKSDILAKPDSSSFYTQLLWCLSTLGGEILLGRKEMSEPPTLVDISANSTMTRATNSRGQQSRACGGSYGKRHYHRALKWTPLGPGFGFGKLNKVFDMVLMHGKIKTEFVHDLRVGCKLNGVEAKVDDYDELGDSMTRWKGVDGKDLESKIDDVMVTKKLTRW
ncbi:hypothetical protein Tco_0891165 [Tanacetum coccineum]|uniref:Uncharacterized protein n=1 Tax=Tanacetum coccineum TaxID=301880 RepID=A0ABQ5C5J3_9ASTR